MSCEHLICAQCAGPVVEGRCPACRAARSRVHHHGFGGLSPVLIAIVLVALLVFTLALRHLYGA
ncbi:hypothetical protein Skr01_15280 [Sphaerisporangium krabiense]|uniref:RING-type domain-containing protein n=1 Tax=Sphaerisporangium krabiense TaxID=763782 RepID=A0A7W8YZB4_9ACTN|nr:hypothetical protein [Sphaerisporangium krabiense]MBB5624603.1 hypothetical protein [Sphaerisporangium krabiense]GII61443.1 hypothetical protein Skr01_15280 [Sphaerisporangium krabiense]